MKTMTQTFLAAGLLSLALAAPAFADDTAATTTTAEPTTGQKIENAADKAGHKAESAAEKTGDFLSDSALTAKVKTALIAEKDLKSMKINVDSKDGVVTLTGELPSTAMIAQAETATKAVKGVKEVHNNLTVKVGKS